MKNSNTVTAKPETKAQVIKRLKLVFWTLEPLVDHPKYAIWFDGQPIEVALAAIEDALNDLG